ncbi:cytochrome P450 [Lactifluus subvellereus]|nr:cytochrome P450 [Lactifluus subvellereus]
MSSFSASPLRLLEVFESSVLQLGQAISDDRITSICVLLGLMVFYTARYITSPYRKLPPGPRSYPIIGNLLELKSAQWLKYTEWQKQYGQCVVTIVSTSILKPTGSGDLIYPNAAGKPMIVSAGIYSDRPPNIVAFEIMCGGLLISLSRYGGVLKMKYETQTTEAVLLSSDLLARPAQWDQNLRRSAESTILSVVYGHPTITSEKNHIVDLINDFSHRLTCAACPGHCFGEFFHWMRYIPSSLFPQAKGDDHQSLGATLIRDGERNKPSSRERSWLVATMYVGGAETTSTLMSWWTLAMLAYLETQARANRTRRSCTICIPNVWHMNHEPKIYGEDAQQFNPVRCLDANGAPGPFRPKSEGIYVGRHMANNSFFINIATVLWARKIEHKNDASGYMLPLDADGFVEHGMLMWAVQLPVAKRDADVQYHDLEGIGNLFRSGTGTILVESSDFRSINQYWGSDSSFSRGLPGLLQPEPEAGGTRATADKDEASEQQLADAAATGSVVL